MIQTSRPHRSSSDRIIAGVCGGLAEYFHESSTMIRLAFILLALLDAGVALVLYLLLAIVMPEDAAGTRGGGLSERAADLKNAFNRVFERIRQTKQQHGDGTFRLLLIVLFALFVMNVFPYHTLISYRLVDLTVTVMILALLFFFMQR